jgi:hypothetical protein
MPQCWALMAAMGLLLVSLFRDACKYNSSLSFGSIVVSSAIAILFVGGLLTLKLLIELCFHRIEVNPGPLFILAGLGLVARSRFWLWASNLILAGSLPLLFVMHRWLWPGPFMGRIDLAVFNRTFDIPKAAYASLILGGGVWLLGTLIIVSCKTIQTTRHAVR